MADQPATGGGVTAFLTRKVGPAPLWAYGVAAAVVGYFVIQHRAAGDTSTPDDDSSDSDDAEQASDTETYDPADFAVPVDTASGAAYTGPGSSSKDPIYIKVKDKGPTGHTAHRLRVITVRKDDRTVGAILNKFGVSLAQLRKDNPGVKLPNRGHHLKVGTKLHVPEGK
jgi:hypothetical protein